MKNFTIALFLSFSCLTVFSQTTTRIITDHQGYWSSTTASPNAVTPDSSHMLIGFTFDGTTYSTGVNDAILTNNGVVFTPGNWHAFPVAGINGTYGSGNGGGISTYVALAKKVDGSPNAANTPAVSNYSIRSALIDGVRGLDLGTGVTNLPTTAIMNFQIFSIDPSKIDDDEPDIILTQIADPSNSVNDIFSFHNENGDLIGNTFYQNTQLLQSFGTYVLDLYNLTPNTPYNSATVYSRFGANTTRDIRVTAVKLSAFGITADNVDDIAYLRISPSSISDYAFIAYNANSINLTPNISQNPPLTNTTICDDGTAHFSVVATPAQGGALTYSWEESTDNGLTWQPVTDGGNYAGATTSRLAVTDPANGNLYRATVAEAGNPNPATAETYQVTVIPTPEAPASVTISGGGTICRGTPVQLTSSVSGGSNLYYEWQSDPTGSGTFTTIPNANLGTYVPPMAETGTVTYRLRVSSGSACIPERISNALVTTINGVSSVTGDERCDAGPVTLNATATSGTINWYDTDVDGSVLASTPTYSPSVSGTTTYYVSSSVCPSALRVPVTATVIPVAPGAVQGSTAVTPGTNSTTLTLTGYAGNVLRWQSSTDGFVSDIVDIPNTSHELTVTNITETTEFRAEVQNGSCAPAFATPAMISVSVLPIRIGSVKAVAENGGIRIQWTAYNQQRTTQFEIERSANGNDYVKVHTVLPTAMDGDVKYQWLDAGAAEGLNYYRIREVLVSGNYDYSAVVSAVFNGGKPAIAAYPNPVMDRVITLQFTGIAAGKFQVSLVNPVGQAVHQLAIAHAGGHNTYKVTVPAAINAGLYRVIVKGDDGKVKMSSGVLIQ